MNSSLIDRLFPHSSQSLLPQHQRSESYPFRKQRSLASSPGADRDGVVTTYHSSPVSSSKNDATLRSAPLSASLIHHDDPFLPIERAARALQANIQSFLDAQSNALNDQIGGGVHEESLSIGSTTPTQSVKSERAGTSIRVVPVRQPAKRKLTLKNARKGLGRSMHEFALLRQEETKLLEAEIAVRQDATHRVIDLQDRRNAIQSEIQSIQDAEPSKAAADLRSEAHDVHNEIQELEHRVLELKVRERHLLGQANQIESSLDSRTSSYKNTLATIDTEIRGFLKRPPVQHAFGGVAASAHFGLYALTPERRTLAMAQEQWSSELTLIKERKAELEEEEKALLQGERMWLNALARINDFELQLRKHTKKLTDHQLGSFPDVSTPTDDIKPKDGSGLSMQQILEDLDNVIGQLEADLVEAEGKNWNLLVAAMGAELEALHQGREILHQTQNLTDERSNGSPNTHTGKNGNLLDGPSTIPTVSFDQKHRRSFDGSEGSNQSLRDTLATFPDQAEGRRLNNRERGLGHGSESEDDEPPRDFLVSS